MVDILFPVALAIVALLYSAVGQAGGTGYVALMGLAGFAPGAIKPTALALNILVSAIGCFRFYRLGQLTGEPPIRSLFSACRSRCSEARYIFRPQPINLWSARCC